MMLYPFIVLGRILSSWLEWCEGPGGASLPAEPLLLYLCLAPRVPLTLNHKGMTTVTTLHIGTTDRNEPGLSIACVLLNALLSIFRGQGSDHS